MNEFDVALLKHPPGLLLAINTHLGRALDLIPQNTLSELSAKANALYFAALKENTDSGLDTYPKDAYLTLFSVLEADSTPYFLPQCACEFKDDSPTTALNVFLLNGLLARYVSDEDLIGIYSALDKAIGDPDDFPSELLTSELAKEIHDFVAQITEKDKAGWDDVQKGAIEKIEVNLTQALHGQKPTFRTRVPFFWVGFDDEPGRSGMAADELRNALGICWDKGSVLVEISFELKHSKDGVTPLYYRPTAINSINSPDGQGGRFMACATNEWPVSTKHNWHGTTAHLNKVNGPSNVPLDSFKELIRKPMPLDADHLKALRIVGVVKNDSSSGDEATLKFAIRLKGQFNLDKDPAGFSTL